jgi:hypothetical protein
VLIAGQFYCLPHQYLRRYAGFAVPLSLTVAVFVASEMADPCG